MITQFENLLQQLGSIFHLELHVDRQNACSILIQNQLTIQLQLDSSQEYLWIFAKIAEIPPGKFRENVLKDALKANGLADPIPAFFGFILTSNQLALCQKYPLSILNGERLSGLIGSFVEMAIQWQEAIKQGQTASLTMRQSNPFGLK